MSDTHGGHNGMPGPDGTPYGAGGGQPQYGGQPPMGGPGPGAPQQYNTPPPGYPTPPAGSPAYGGPDGPTAAYGAGPQDPTQAYGAQQPYDQQQYGGQQPYGGQQQQQYGGQQFGPQLFDQPQYGQQAMGAPGQPGQPGQPWDPYNAAPAPRRRGKMVVAVSITVVAVLGLAGGAYAVFGGGGGGAGGGSADPAIADYVPSDAVAYASVNLDPSNGEKISTLNFFRSFPSLGDGSGGNNLVDGLFGAALKDSAFNEDFQQNVRPWIGSQIAIAADPQGEGKVSPIIVAAVTDQGKAKQGLSNLATKADGELKYTFRDDYVIMGETQEIVDAASTDSAKSSLRDSAEYSQDIKALDDERVLTGWVNLGEVAQFLPNSSELPANAAKGRIAFQLAFGKGYGEFFATVKGATGTAQPAIGMDVAALPDNTAAAVGISGLDDLITQALDAVESSGLDNPLTDLEDQTGLTLPDDISGLLGDKTVVATNDDLSGVGLITSADATKAQATVDKLITASGADGIEVATQTAGDRTVFASSQDYADELAQGGTLGNSPMFKKAVPDANKAAFVAYADVSGLISATGASDAAPLDAQAVKAVGLTTVSDGKTASVRLRVLTG